MDLGKNVENLAINMNTIKAKQLREDTDYMEQLIEAVKNAGFEKPLESHEIIELMENMANELEKGTYEHIRILRKKAESLKEESIRKGICPECGADLETETVYPETRMDVGVYKAVCPECEWSEED